MKDNHKTHAAMITRMDRDVGLLAKKIQELGLAENTLILFTSDHGAHGQSGTAKFFNSCGKLRGIKRSMYEGGIRTPLVAYWPGKIAKSSQSDHLSGFWDMMPTLAELANTEIPVKHDGISFVPELLGKTSEQKKHEFLYWELFESRRHNRAIRMGKWKAVIPNYYKSKQPELYDLEADESESKNLAAKHPDIVAKLTALMNKARVRNEFWNVDSRGFNLAAACKATNIAVPEKAKPSNNKNKK